MLDRSGAIDLFWRRSLRNTTEIGLLKDGLGVGFASLGHAWDRTAIFENLRVDPALRGQGYGRWLVAAGVHLAFAQGAGTLTLMADDDGSGRLCAWYRRLGFQRMGTATRARTIFRATVSPGRWPLPTALKQGDWTNGIKHSDL